MVKDALTAALIADVSYGKELKEVLSRVPVGYELVQFKAQEGSSPQWVILQGEGQVVVSFRGSKSALDFLVTTSFAPRELAVAGVGSLRVHGGVLAQLQPQLPGLLSALQECRPGFARVRVVGHSLGGSYAQLAVLLLLGARPELAPVCDCFSFGAPLLFAGMDLAAQLSGVFTRYHIFVNQADVVPRSLGSNSALAKAFRFLETARHTNESGAAITEALQSELADIEDDAKTSDPGDTEYDVGTSKRPLAAFRQGLLDRLEGRAVAVRAEEPVITGSGVFAAVSYLRQTLGAMARSSHLFHAVGHCYVIWHRLEDLRTEYSVRAVSPEQLHAVLLDWSGVSAAGRHSVGSLVRSHKLVGYTDALRAALGLQQSSL